MLVTVASKAISDPAQDGFPPAVVAMDTVGVDPGMPVKVLQEPQQKASSVTGSVMLMIRLVKLEVVLVQDAPTGKVS